MTSRSRTIAIALVAVLAAAALGYWAYSANKKRELHNAIVALVQDANQRLRGALGAESAPPSAGTVKKLDEHASAVDGRLQELKRVDASFNLAMADAADSYLVTAREILRRQTASHRGRLLLADSLPALREHMRADNRTGSWVQEAVKAKERVEKDFREYRVAAEQLGKLLDSLTRDQAKIAPHAPELSPVEESLVSDARKQALAAYKQLAEEVEKTKQLEAYR